MRPLREIRGLRFPDEYVVRHFFKRGLADRIGRVLELGCGTGNNLSLYHAWDWACVGFDNDPAALDAARYNLGDIPELTEVDLSEDLLPLSGSFDVLLLPNILCYLRRGQSIALLRAVRPRLVPGCELFVRTRMWDDYRYGRGQEEGPDAFRLETPETGEAGLLNQFYTQAGLVELLTDTLELTDATVLSVRFDNVQAGQVVAGNSDIVVWGRAG